MKKFAVSMCVLCAVVFAADLYDPKTEKNKLVVPMQLLSKDGNVSIGDITIVETKYGLAFYPMLDKLKSGIYGFHVHQNGDCGPTEKGLGMKAGGHWDPTNAGKHSYPWDNNGHKGDLPVIYVNKDGKAMNPVLAPKIKSLSELKNKALMIHEGSDNHHDHPKPLGGGGPRMACGVIN